MIDIETFGVGNQAPIESIGAVVFDEIEIREAFHRHIPMQDMDKFVFDSDTILWWMKQSELARKSVTNGIRDIPLAKTLADLNQLIKSADYIIAKGSHFDIPILMNAYKVMGVEVGFHWYNVVDLRTFIHAFPDMIFPKVEGIKHNALDDCVNQVNLIYNNKEIFKGLFREIY